MLLRSSGSTFNVGSHSSQGGRYQFSRRAASLRHVAELFPVQHLADALHHAYDPATHGVGLVWTDLALLAAWAGVGLAVTRRRFRWIPVGG